jgi:hypothetical protein
MNNRNNNAIIIFIRTHKNDTRKIYWFLNKILDKKLYSPDSIIFCKIQNILQKKTVQNILQQDKILTFHEMLRINLFINKYFVDSL